MDDGQTSQIHRLPAPHAGTVDAVAIRPHSELVTDWLKALEQDVAAGAAAEATHRAYRKTIQPWLEFLAQKAIDRPTPKVVGEYLAWLRAQESKKPATINAHLQSVRGLYRWAELQDRYPAIARSVRSLPVRRDGPLPIISLEHLARAISELERGTAANRKLAPWEIQHQEVARLRDVAFLRVLYGTGVRLISMARADVLDLQLDSSPPSMRHQGKGARGKDDVAVLPAMAAEALRRYLQAREELKLTSPALWIGLRPRPASRLNVGSMRRILSKAFEQSGIRQRDVGGQLVEPRTHSPHAVRRSAITRVVEQFGLEGGRQFGGHASTEITRKAYARVTRFQTLVDAAGALEIMNDASLDTTKGSEP